MAKIKTRVWNSRFSSFLCEKCRNGNVSNVGAFFLHHPMWPIDNLDECFFLGMMSDTMYITRTHQ